MPISRVRRVRHVSGESGIYHISTSNNGRNGTASQSGEVTVRSALWPMATLDGTSLRRRRARGERMLRAPRRPVSSQ